MLHTLRGDPAALNHLSNLPTCLSRWLGYRSSLPRQQPRYITCLWSFVASFCGLAVLQLLFGHAQYFVDRDVPPIIPSFGATAVLTYSAIEAPFSQPRALVASQIIGSVVGIGITRLFQLLPAERFQSLEWIVGSLSVAITIVIMEITETTHPPAGATALVAAVDPDVRTLGWYFLPVILLSSAIVLLTALLLNNVQRRYPVFWIKPVVPLPAQLSEIPGGSERMNPHVAKPKLSDSTLGTAFDHDLEEGHV
ncbi:MAG: hypothetical protein Q9190_002340 [Brigantiaea leucoxantha]